MQVVLTVAIGGLVAYLLYALGLVPGADILQRELRPWGAAVITLVGSGLALLALWAKQYADSREHKQVTVYSPVCPSRRREFGRVWR